MTRSIAIPMRALKVLLCVLGLPCVCRGSAGASCACLGDDGTWGSTCHAWNDNGASEFRSSCNMTNPRPSWCSQQWCYVAAPLNCSLRIHRSTDTHNSGKYWSYEVCGNPHPEVNPLPLDGSTLRVVVPGIWYPTHYKRNPTTGAVYEDGKGAAYYDDTIKYEGAYVDYMEAVQREAAKQGSNFKIVYTHISDWSANLNHSSSWTAAIYDIEQGRVDMALSDYWITAERMRLGPFTIETHRDDLRLYVRAPAEDKGLLKEASRVYEPFESTMWYLLLGVIPFMGCVTLLLDGLPESEDIDSEATNATKIVVWLRSFVHASSHSATMLLGGGGGEVVTKPSLTTQMINMGWNLFAMLVISTYTANLTAFLTRTSRGVYIQSMEAALSGGHRICGEGVLETEMKTKYPQHKFVFYNLGWTELVAGFERNECDAIVVPRHWAYQLPDLHKRMCDSGLIQTDFVLSKPISFPVANSSLGGDLGHWISRLHVSGKTLEQYFPPHVQHCSFNIDDIQAADTTPIGASHLFWPAIVLAGISIISVVYTTIKRSRSTSEDSKVDQKEGSENDSAVAERLQSLEQMLESHMQQTAGQGKALKTLIDLQSVNTHNTPVLRRGCGFFENDF